MATYNGHRSWAYWNVSLWINNDEGLYNLARDCVRQNKTRKQAAQSMMSILAECGAKRTDNGAICTPDGATYSVDKIQSAMRGM